MSGTGKVTVVVLEKVNVQDGFWMVIYTIFIFPILIFIFVVQELQPKSDRLASICNNFYFLDYHIGKGLYLMLCGFLVLQHTNVTQWLIALAVISVALVNLVHPCLLGATPINGEMVHVGLARTDATVLRDLERAEAEAFKNKVLKPKDPASTAKARQRLEQEGRSIEEEKNKVQMS